MLWGKGYSAGDIVQVHYFSNPSALHGFRVYVYVCVCVHSSCLHACISDNMVSHSS